MFTQSLTRTASWVIREKETACVICETFNGDAIPHLKPQYEAVPILQYLQELNRNIHGGSPAITKGD
jgi:hypothetical protein